MKSGNATTGEAVSLQALQGRKARLSGSTRKQLEVSGPIRKEKRDKVKEYMEEKFFEQFMPKRDASARIRKLSLDKNSLRRAQGNFKKQQPGTDGAGGTFCISVKKRKKGLNAAQEQKRKRRQPRVKSAREICLMVGLCNAVAFSRVKLEPLVFFVDLKVSHTLFYLAVVSYPEVFDESQVLSEVNDL